jgi:hypothetical protein
MLQPCQCAVTECTHLGPCLQADTTLTWLLITSLCALCHLSSDHTHTSSQSNLQVAAKNVCPAENAGTAARLRESLVLDLVSLSSDWRQLCVRLLTKMHGRAAVGREDVQIWLHEISDNRVDRAQAAVCEDPALYGLLRKDVSGGGSSDQHLSDEAVLQILMYMKMQLGCDITALKSMESCYLASDLRPNVLALMTMTMYAQAVVPCPLAVHPSSTTSGPSAVQVTATKPAITPVQVTATCTATCTADVTADVTDSSRSDAPATALSMRAQRAAEQAAARELRQLASIASYASSVEGTVVTVDDIRRRFPNYAAHGAPSSANSTHVSAPNSSPLSSSSNSSTIPAENAISNSSSSSSSSDNSSSSSNTEVVESSLAKIVTNFNKLVSAFSFGVNSGSSTSTAPPSPTHSS